MSFISRTVAANVHLTCCSAPFLSGAGANGDWTGLQRSQHLRCTRPCRQSQHILVSHRRILLDQSSVRRRPCPAAGRGAGQGRSRRSRAGTRWRGGPLRRSARSGTPQSPAAVFSSPRGLCHPHRFVSRRVRIGTAVSARMLRRATARWVAVWLLPSDGVIRSAGRPPRHDGRRTPTGPFRAGSTAARSRKRDGGPGRRGSAAPRTPASHPAGSPDRRAGHGGLPA